MTGIVFFGTTDLDRVVAFYRDRLDFGVWLEQPDCTILRFDTLLVGFCARDEAETDGVVTVVYDSENAVDDRYDALADVADDPPSVNEPYEIYNFFGTDPDGRAFEVQTFRHDIDTV